MARDIITRRSILKCVGTVSGATIVGSRPKIASATTDQPKSTTIRIPVAVTPGGPQQYEIAADLILSPKSDRQSIIQVLVPGLTYDRHYYDFSYRPKQYSYVRRAIDAGYSVLNIDRIGSGQSDHPPPEYTTLATNAVVLQQVIQALRAGDVRGIEISEVILVGHGYGALVSVKQQAEYGIADYLILTGYTQQYAHLPNLPSWLVPTETIPAQQTTLPHVTDPLSGYRTTMAGNRAAYYYKANADPAVIAVDDRHRQTITKTERETATEIVDASLKIAVPVLEVVGDQDSVFCGTKACTAPLGARTTEPVLWPNADFTMKVLSGVGHALFLHRSVPTAFSQIETWATEHVNT